MSRSTSTNPFADQGADHEAPGLLERRSLLRAGVASLGALWFPALAVRAQSGASVTTNDLGGGLSLLQVSGVNALSLRGERGALLVDGGPAASAAALLDAVRAATGNDTVDTLINTHGHPDQTGANGLVARAGGTILAHEKTRDYLSHAGYSALFEGRREPLPEAARPTQTVRGEGSLDVGGARVDYGYLPAAHTDGDLFVHFSRQNVLAVGGVVGDGWPLLDWRNGAWFGGRVRALQRLASLVKPDTRVVPSEGQLRTGRDVARLREIYDALFVTMIEYMDSGLGADDVVARNPLREHEAELGSAAKFLDGAYRSMQIAYVPD